MARSVQIRFAISFIAMTVVLGGVWLAPGSASTRTAAHGAVSTDDCEALQSISDEVPDVSNAGNLGKAQLKATATGMKATAKKIDDKKLRSAMKTLGKVYNDASKAGGSVGAVGVFVKNGRRYGKATATFSTAILGCVTSQITLPKNVTLPSGITLPTLPK